ncbi:MAG: hypothetical protein ACREYE_23775 [Gammaproteobacteria bacterium]
MKGLTYSAEIRWFFPWALPEPLVQWFSQEAHLEHEGVRHDRYLLFPRCDTVGVKLREGLLEIKARVAPPVPFNLGRGLSGRTDQWVKWSFSAAGIKALTAELIELGRWIEVGKTRLVQRVSADPGRLRRVAAREEADNGCDIELTEITVATSPRSWFSLAFEAFGDAQRTSCTLHETLDWFFERRGPLPDVTLAMQDSLSYPAWLATLSLR